MSNYHPTTRREANLAARGLVFAKPKLPAAQVAIVGVVVLVLGMFLGVAVSFGLGVFLAVVANVLFTVAIVQAILNSRR